MDLVAGHYILYTLNDINNSGWIVGSGVFDFLTQAFVLIPLASGDLDLDGFVNTADLLILLADWGPCDSCNLPGECTADIDEDCIVSTIDLLILLSQWG